MFDMMYNVHMVKRVMEKAMSEMPQERYVPSVVGEVFQTRPILGNFVWETYTLVRGMESVLRILKAARYGEPTKAFCVDHDYREFRPITKQENDMGKLPRLSDVVGTPYQPKVGEVCESTLTVYKPEVPWAKIKIVFVGKDIVVYTDLDQPEAGEKASSLSVRLFRKLKTEEEVFVEEYVKVRINTVGFTGYAGEGAEMYAKGFRYTGEGK